MAYSKDDIRRIHSTGTAVYNKSYIDSEGNKYIGTKTGRLKLSEKADKIRFDQTDNNKSNNVQEAIETVEGDLNNLEIVVENNYNELNLSIESAKCYALVMSLIL